MYTTIDNFTDKRPLVYIYILRHFEEILITRTRWWCVYTVTPPIDVNKTAHTRGSSQTSATAGAYLVQ